MTIIGANFTVFIVKAYSLSPTTYSISGTITAATNGSGATVTLSGASSATTTANSSGNYSFTGLANGSYTITASKTGFTFTPSHFPGDDKRSQRNRQVNFTASTVGLPTTYSISGTITAATNGSGATVTLSGASSVTTTANSSGNYSFTGLANGSYTVIASKTGFTFTPATSPVTIAAEPTVTGVNFTASTASPTTYSISGTITAATNGSGATVTLSAASRPTTTPNSSGATTVLPASPMVRTP